MKEKIENLKWRLKQKWMNFKQWLGMRFRKFWDWICNNIETLIPLIPVIIVVIKSAVNLIFKASSDKRRNEALEKEEMLKNRYIYDRSAGFYWNINKDLSQGERMAIDARHRAGEPYSKILSDMKLL